MPIAEVATAYKARPAGSASKLCTYRDGLRILRTMAAVEERAADGVLRAGRAAAAAGLGFVPVFFTYLETGLVPRLPTAILSTGLMLLAFLSLVCGLILDTVTRGRMEAKRLAYLSVPGPAFHPDALEVGRRA